MRRAVHDRPIDVRARSGDTIVFEGGWSVSLAFKD